MADLIDDRRPRGRYYLLVMVALGFMCVGLGVVMVLSLRCAGAVKDNPDLRRTLTQLAWTSLVLMVGTSILLVWALIRVLGQRVTKPLLRGPKAERIDAWAEAGRRFEVDDEDDDETP